MPRKGSLKLIEESPDGAVMRLLRGMPAGSAEMPPAATRPMVQ